MRHWRMTVHNESFVVPRAVEELITNPDQIICILMFDRNIRTNARMHEQEISATELVAQALHDQFVCTRKRVEKAAMQIACCLRSVVQLDTVGRKCLHAAQLLPVLQDGRILQKTFHHSFVVAAQAHRAIGDEPHREQIEHRSRVRSAIDIVAEIDFDRMRDRPAPYVVVDARNYFAQQIGAAVDVTDRIDACIRGR